MSLNSLSNSASISCVHVLFLSIFLEPLEKLSGVFLALSLVHWP